MKKLNLNSEIIKTKGSPKSQANEPSKASVVQTKLEKTPAKNKKPRFNPFKKLGSIIKKYQSLPMRKKVLVTVLACLSITVLCGGIYYLVFVYRWGSQNFTIPSQIKASEPSSTEFDSKIPTPMPNPPRDKENPINGELYTAKEYKDMLSRFPIAIMIDNHIDARNQSGYLDADLVYETLAEGGITRNMMILWGRSAKELGPIRSARQYFIEWMYPFDTLYMHVGWASSTDPRVDAGGNMIKLGVRTMDRAGTYWRSKEKFAPHNAYSSSEILYNKAPTFGYTGAPKEIESWQFKKDAKIGERGPESTVSIVFFERLNNGGLYDVTWTYDPEKNVYLRSINNTPHIDQNYGTQVYAKNVIIDRVEMISTYDSKGHIIITTIGEGDSIILRDGQITKGRWKKPAIENRTRYYDASGEEIEFNRGITWIEAVPIEQGSVSLPE